VKLNSQIFREYDIRGTVDVDLSEDFAFLLGRAYGEKCKETGHNNIGIGHDCRLTSPKYAKALMSGLSTMGISSINTGMGPTPQLYFSIFAKDFGGGIQVTGSHNPSDMNGFKICLGKHTLSGADIKELEARMRKLQNIPASPINNSLMSDGLIQEEYCNYLINNSKPFMGKRKLKVVVDAGNGVGGLVGPKVLRALGVEVIELFCEPDGRFPNHHPDPTELKNLKQLIAEVKKHKADCGIGWDGDADRIGAVDENGDVIFGDMLLLIFGRSILNETPGATIIGDVKCSEYLYSDLTKRGANAVMWKTGHSLIKGKLKETNGLLAGEMSGHIFFKHRYFGFDDAIYSSCRLVEILSQSDKKASELLNDLPIRCSTPEIRVDCPEEIKFKIVSEAQKAFSDYRVNTIDGARITFEKGWGLIRASNTQPVLVMRFEAEKEDLLKQYQQIVESRIAEIKDSLA
jgi:phosphomannomutase/phosphoglucomutase